MKFEFLKKKDITKSKILIINDLNLNFFIKLLFLFKKKNSLIILVNKPKNFLLYKFAITCGLNVKILDWNIFSFKERFASHRKAYKNIEDYYSAIISNTYFSNKIVENLYENNSEITKAPKKFFIQILFNYYNFNFAVLNLKKINKNIEALTSLEWRTTHEIHRDYLSNEFKEVSGTVENFATRFIDKFFAILKKILLIVVFLLIPFYIISKIRIKKNKLRNYNIAFRLYNSGYRFNDNEYRIDWLLEDRPSSLSKKNNIFVAEESLDNDFLKKIRENNYNFLICNLKKIYFEKKTFPFLKKFFSNYFIFFINLIFRKDYEIYYLLNSLLYYLKWSSFISLCHPKLYVSYHDHNIQHIFRYAILKKIGTKQILYKHTYSENIYNINYNTQNILYAYQTYDKEIHWGKKSIEMSQQNLSNSKNFLISKPIIMDINRKSLININFESENISIAAFASTFGQNCVNDANSHLLFLNSILNLIEKETHEIKISKIYFKGKRPFKLYLESDNLDLRFVAEKLLLHKKFIAIDSNISSYSLIQDTDLSFSMSFSSTTIEALSLGKRSFFYDCTSQFENSYYSNIPNLVASNSVEFKNCLKFWKDISKNQILDYYNIHLKNEFGNYDLYANSTEIVKKYIQDELKSK